MKTDTKLISLGRKKDWTLGAVNPAISRASTIVFDSMDEMYEAEEKSADEHLYYGRRGTGATFALKSAITELEGAEGCYLFPCGTSAITSSLMAFLSPGDNLLMVESAYQPTKDFCNKTLSRFGVSTTYYHPSMGVDISSVIKSNTRVIFLESPGSLTMEVQDIKSIVDLAKEKQIVTMMDNTYYSPINFLPIKHGIDISIHSATKYISGHSDLMLGIASANQSTWKQLQDSCYRSGLCVSADDCYTALRGLRTLGVRMREHQKKALVVAHWLVEQPQVDHLRHPAFSSCPGHEYFKRDGLQASGLFSFVLRGKKGKNLNAVKSMADNMRHFKLGFSWGGFESLILPVLNTHRHRSYANIRQEQVLVRLHIGLENTDDLIEI